MLFADGYWEIKNLNDTIAVVGLFLTLLSIWLSWWLATRDIERRLREATEAARAEIRRVARTLTFSGVSDAIRTLALVREACKSKRWPNAADHCESGLEQLNRLQGQAALDAVTRQEVHDAIVRLREFTTRLRKLPKPRSGTLSDDTAQLLDTALAALQTIEGRLRTIDPEGIDGR